VTAPFAPSVQIAAPVVVGGVVWVLTDGVSTWHPGLVVAVSASGVLGQMVLVADVQVLGAALAISDARVAVYGDRPTAIAAAAVSAMPSGATLAASAAVESARPGT
jgi:hypothetical protein